MPNDEFQKERPQIQKEPSPSDARSETRLPLADDNRFQRPDQVWNPTALTAFCLAVLSITFWWCIKGNGPWLSPAQDSMTKLYIFLFIVLGPAALIFGILGCRYRKRHPIAGGLGFAIFGIVIGILISILDLYIIVMTGPFIGVPGGGFR